MFSYWNTFGDFQHKPLNKTKIIRLNMSDFWILYHIRPVFIFSYSFNYISTQKCLLIPQMKSIIKSLLILYKSDNL